MTVSSVSSRRDRKRQASSRRPSNTYLRGATCDEKANGYFFLLLFTFRRGGEGGFQVTEARRQ